jgi:hypothetical protein
MASSTEKEVERWDRMTENIDLLFARFGDIERVQQYMATQINLSAQIKDQVLRDRNSLAQKLNAKSVSQLSQKFPTAATTLSVRHQFSIPSGSGEVPSSW